MAKKLPDHNLLPYGFRVWRGRASRMSGAHAHGDVEVNVVVAGSLRYFFAGRLTTIHSGELALFWAGIPHQLIDLARATEVIWVTIPLAWVLQWRGTERLRQRLLAGDLLIEPVGRDRVLIERWAADYASGTADLQEIVALEVEARIRRLSRTAWPAARGRAAVAGTLLERATRVIGERYTENLTVADVAAAVEVHPQYLMRAFKAQCGMGLWEYVLRLRVSHAQRLLVTTDRKMIDIALDAGFGAVSRFYATFRRVCGTTPRAYRHAMRG